MRNAQETYANAGEQTENLNCATAALTMKKLNSIITYRIKV